MGEETATAPATSWVLVIAGVTPLGRRRAVRAVSHALDAGQKVVVIDGQVPALSAEDLDSADPSRVTVYSFGVEERRRLAARLTEPASNARRGRLWRSVGRRVGTVLRPWAVWSRARSAIRSLSRQASPERIVCCDESSITTAWKATRIWPGVPVGSE